jgi:hypothetical protein
VYKKEPLPLDLGTMSRHRRYPVLVVTGVVILACATTGNGGDGESLAIRTHHTSFQLTARPGFSAREAVVQVTLTNRGQNPRFVRVCGQKQGDTLVVGGRPLSEVVNADSYDRIDGIGVEWACLDAAPRVILPRNAILDSVRLATLSEAWCATHGGQPIRIRYWITNRALGVSEREPGLPMSEQVSNAFVVRCRTP